MIYDYYLYMSSIIEQSIRLELYVNHKDVEDFFQSDAVSKAIQFALDIKEKIQKINEQSKSLHSLILSIRTLKTQSIIHTLKDIKSNIDREYVNKIITYIISELKINGKYKQLKVHLKKLMVHLYEYELAINLYAEMQIDDLLNSTKSKTNDKDSNEELSISSEYSEESSSSDEIINQVISSNK